MTQTYFLESVYRTMKILDCFTEDAPVLRLTDLSQRSGLSRVQVLRIASTLEAGGYLTRDPETKRYRLGIRLFHLGMLVRQQMDLRRIAEPYLQWLVDETQETARLVVPETLGPICIAVVESPRGIRVSAQLGARMPWNAATSPKVLLAYLPEDKREEILSRGQFRKFTEHTVTDPDALRAEVLGIRDRGYHIGILGDLDPDASGVSAPVFDEQGEIVAAVNVSAPASRLTTAEAPRFIELVVHAAREISTQLGYRPDQATHRSGDGTAPVNGPGTRPDRHQTVTDDT